MRRANKVCWLALLVGATLVLAAPAYANTVTVQGVKIIYSKAGMTAELRITGDTPDPWIDLQLPSGSGGSLTVMATAAARAAFPAGDFDVRITCPDAIELTALRVLGLPRSPIGGLGELRARVAGWYFASVGTLVVRYGDVMGPTNYERYGLTWWDRFVPRLVSITMGNAYGPAFGDMPVAAAGATRSAPRDRWAP